MKCDICGSQDTYVKLHKHEVSIKNEIIKEKKELHQIVEKAVKEKNNYDIINRLDRMTSEYVKKSDIPKIYESEIKEQYNLVIYLLREKNLMY